MDDIELRIKVFNKFYTNKFQKRLYDYYGLDIDSSNINKAMQGFNIILILDQNSDVNYVEELFSCNNSKKLEELESFIFLLTCQGEYYGLQYELYCVLDMFKEYYNTLKNISDKEIEDYNKYIEMNKERQEKLIEFDIKYKQFYAEMYKKYNGSLSIKEDIENMFGDFEKFEYLYL